MRVSWAWVGRQGTRLVTAAASVCLLATCSSDTPTEPATPGRYTLTGRVRLTGYMVDANAQPAGQRVVDDADGVKVELMYGNAVQATTTTVDGGYRFPNLAPGAYQVRSRVVGSVADETSVITIVSWDLTAADTLRLTAMGDLRPVPNPAADTVAISFWIAAPQVVSLRIRNLQSTPIQTLFEGPMTAGLRTVRWDGRDTANHPVTGSMYWATFESGADIRAHLLFR